MLAIVAAAPFQHIDEAFDIRINIGVGVLKRIANSCLRREMDDHRKAMPSEKATLLPCDPLRKREVGIALQNVETCLLQLWIVIAVDDIKTNDLAASRQQALRNVKPDEAGSSGDQYRIVRHRFSGSGFRAAIARFRPVLSLDRASF